MKDDHPHRRAYDHGHWPVRSDGNGNFLVGRSTTFISFGLLVLLLGGAIYGTTQAVLLRTAVNHSLEQSSMSSLQIQRLSEDQRKFENVMAETLSKLRTRVALLEFQIDKLERPNPRVGTFDKPTQSAGEITDLADSR